MTAERSTIGPRRRGVLLVNLGTPDSPSVPDVKRYLGQFLMDPRVLTMSWWRRALLVYGLILPKHSEKSAAHYRAIWTDDGSPLMVYGQRVLKELQTRLDSPVALGMRYGNPSIKSALRHLTRDGRQPIDEVLLVPMYPHYAFSSYETAVAEVRRHMPRRVALTIKSPYYDDPQFIEALTESASPYLAKPFDHILFSYHNIPEAHLHINDETRQHCLTHERCCIDPSPAHEFCYRAQVHRTTEAFALKADVSNEKYSLSFQSRFGSDQWLEPETEAEIVRLAQSGVRRLLVICPGFVADCLETVEEVAIDGKGKFIEAGGEEFTLIPCLNDHPRWIDTLEQWCAITSPTIA